ncbi:MAG: hypothetical protein EXR39_02920 [Betaproteobacteria bacterium]|nr:hypothetical protein [Betaproteobacteria bacterium]
MIKLHDLHYVRIGTRDLAGAIEFATRIIGLALVRREGGVAYLRSVATQGDAPDHTLVYFDGDPSDQTIGLQLADPADFNAAAAAIEATGQRIRIGTEREASGRRVRQLMAFRAASGHRIEIVARPHQGDARRQSMRDAGLTRLSHIGLRTSNASRDAAFWMRSGMLRVSDRIGDVALLRMGTRHHSLALYPSGRTGLQHVSFAVKTLDDLMRSWYFLREQGVKILFGPGRDPTSSAIFLYFAGPDKMIYAYSYGMREIQPALDASYRPRQFPFAPQSFCLWGALPEMAEFGASVQGLPLTQRFAT